MQPVLMVLKGSDARRRYKPPARPYHLFYYTGFVNTFTENGRTFYPYPPLRGGGWLPQQVEKEWKEAFPRFVIPSAAEGSFSLAVKRRVFDSRERETPYHGRAEAVLPLKGLAKGSWEKGTKKISRIRSK